MLNGLENLFTHGDEVVDADCVVGENSLRLRLLTLTARAGLLTRRCSSHSSTGEQEVLENAEAVVFVADEWEVLDRVRIYEVSEGSSRKHLRLKSNWAIKEAQV